MPATAEVEVSADALRVLASQSRQREASLKECVERDEEQGKREMRVN